MSAKSIGTREIRISTVKINLRLQVSHFPCLDTNKRISSLSGKVKIFEGNKLRLWSYLCII